MSLKILFALSLDGYRPQENRSRIDELICGPATLLDVLEIRLGLRAKAVPFARRVAQYRTLLAKALVERPRFYSASFERDAFAVAEVLLRWRDELVLAGWTALADANDSQRLRDFADVEQSAAGTLASGVGDRIKAILVELEGREPHLGAVEVMDDRAHLPALLRRLLERLGASFGWLAREKLDPRGELGTDLRRIQEALLKPEDCFELRGDESVLVFTAGSEVTLAHAAAQIMQRCRQQKFTASLIAEIEGLHLDAALRALDEPAVAMAPFSSLRPVLQLLPLALRLRWAPLDPGHLLEFLTHPVAPMDRVLRDSLAHAVAEHPGIGGAGWQQAIVRSKFKIEETFANDSAARSKALARIDTDIATWLDCERFDPIGGASGEVLSETCSRLAQWAVAAAQGVNGAALSEQYQAAASQAAEVGKILRSLESVTQPQLNRILDQASGIGSQGIDDPVESGSIPCVNSAGAAIEAADVLLWWGFFGPPTPPTTPWTSAEIEQLARHGAEVLSRAAQLSRGHLASLLPVFAARKQIIFFTPRQAGNDAVAHHPLYDRLRALVIDHKLPVFDLDEFVGRPDTPWPHTTPITMSNVELHRLARLQRWWKLPDKNHLGPRKQESFTSAAGFTFSPYQWVLKYKAKLRPGVLFGNQSVRDVIQRGNLLHRIFELFFAEAARIDWLRASPAEVEAWTTSQWQQLLPTDGANLLLHGKRAVAESLLGESNRALWRLVEHLREAGVTKVKVNYEPTAGPFDGGTIGGKIDLLVETASGRLAVIDMKYRQLANKRSELKNNLQLQLAIYGYLVAAGGTWPDAAYFILTKGSLLAQNHDYFSGAVEVPTSNGVQAGLEPCWLQFQKAWQWRRELLDQGWIEVTVGGTGAGIGSAPPANIDPVIARWQPQKDADRYNDFDALTGWKENA